MTSYNASRVFVRQRSSVVCSPASARSSVQWSRVHNMIDRSFNWTFCSSEVCTWFAVRRSTDLISLRTLMPLMCSVAEMLQRPILPVDSTSWRYLAVIVITTLLTMTFSVRTMATNVNFWTSKLGEMLLLIRIYSPLGAASANQQEIYFTWITRVSSLCNRVQQIDT